MDINLVETFHHYASWIFTPQNLLQVGTAVLAQVGIRAKENSTQRKIEMTTAALAGLTYAAEYLYNPNHSSGALPAAILSFVIASRLLCNYTLAKHGPRLGVLRKRINNAYLAAGLGIIGLSAACSGVSIAHVGAASIWVMGNMRDRSDDDADRRRLAHIIMLENLNLSFFAGAYIIAASNAFGIALNKYRMWKEGIPAVSPHKSEAILERGIQVALIMLIWTQLDPVKPASPSKPATVECSRPNPGPATKASHCQPN